MNVFVFHLFFFRQRTCIGHIILCIYSFFYIEKKDWHPYAGVKVGRALYLKMNVWFRGITGIAAFGDHITSFYNHDTILHAKYPL